MATGVSSAQLMGVMPTLPDDADRGLGGVQIFNRIYLGNGHCRNVVTDGRLWLQDGLRPPLVAPIASEAGGGNVEGRWRFFTQFYDSWRGAYSNLSPCSPEIEVSYKLITVTLNVLNELPDGTYVPREPCDYVQIWALNVDTGQLKRVGLTPVSNTIWTFSMTSDQFDAIVADDSVASAIGNIFKNVSLGFDPFPACRYYAFQYGRRFGILQKNYKHPGAITVTAYTDLESWEKEMLNGAVSWNGGVTRVGTEDEVKRAKVTLNPVPVDSRWTKIWDTSSASPSPSEKTYIAVSPNKDSLVFVIDNRIIAKFTKEGNVFLRGNATEQGAMVPPARTHNVQWDTARHAILINLNTGTVGVPVWQGCIVLDLEGNLTFDRESYINYEPSIVKAPAAEPIYWASNHTLFLPYLSTTGIGYSSLHYLRDPGFFNDFFMTSLSENATDSQLSGYPLFDTGLMYKALFVRGQFVGYVWDVFPNDLTLWLMDDYLASSIANESDWEIVGLNSLFYSKFNYPEGGYFGESLMQENKGTLFYSEFDPDSGQTPVGLNNTPWGLEVLFKEKGFIIRAQGSETPIAFPEIQRIESRETVHAPASIASDRQARRIALSSKPKGVSVSAGGRTDVITDVTGNRAVLSRDIDQSTSAQACGVFFSDTEGDRYCLFNLDRKGDSDGSHGVSVDFRGLSEPHVTRLDGLPVRAVCTISRDDGDDIVMYGGTDGKIGYLFNGSPSGVKTDLGEIQESRTRWYLSIANGHEATFSGMRIFAYGTTTLPIGAEPVFTATLYGVGSLLSREELLGDLSAYDSVILAFSRANLTDSTHGRFMTAHDPLTSSSFVLELECKSHYAATLLGVEFDVDVPES